MAVKSQVGSHGAGWCRAADEDRVGLSYQRQHFLAEVAGARARFDIHCILIWLVSTFFMPKNGKAFSIFVACEAAFRPSQDATTLHRKPERILFY